jgi:hypothetical protein
MKAGSTILTVVTVLLLVHPVNAAKRVLYKDSYHLSHHPFFWKFNGSRSLPAKRYCQIRTGGLVL